MLPSILETKCLGVESNLLNILSTVASFVNSKCQALLQKSLFQTEVATTQGWPARSQATCTHVACIQFTLLLKAKSKQKQKKLSHLQHNNKCYLIWLGNLTWSMLAWCHSEFEKYLCQEES